ncbi:MAG: O-antigen ligase family protein [Eubacterium sp.]|nr:O-antigen ligase family protein [Eubacterium sp.]
MKSKLCSNTDKKLYYWLLFVMGPSMLLPEYIAPLFVFFGYIGFIVHFKKTGRNARLGDIGKVIFAYTVFMLISTIWSKAHLATALIALLNMGCFLTYIATANTVNSKEKLKTAILVINITSGVIGLIAIIEFVSYYIAMYTSIDFVFPNPLYYEINDKVFKMLPVDIVNDLYDYRASVSFDNPLILSTYLIVTTPFCAFGSVYYNTSKNRKISRICLVLSIAGIVTTLSRGAYVALGLSVLIMLMSNKKLFKKLFPFLLVVAISVSVGIFLRFKSQYGDFFSSNNTRFIVWKSCIDMFIHHPILGLGCGTENIHTLLRDTYNIDRAHAHNLFLQIITEGGIVGGAFGVTTIVFIVKRVKLLFKTNDEFFKPYAALFTSALGGFAFTSVFEHTLQSAKEMMIFFVLIGLLEATARIMQNDVQLADDEKLTYELTQTKEPAIA